MIKIKFSNEEVMREVALSLIGNHVVEIIGLSEPNLTGFETYRYSDEKKLGDFSDFTTLFRTVDGGFQFSNDGSIYPYVPDPTTQEKVETLQEQVAGLEQNATILNQATRELAKDNTLQNENIALTQDALCETVEDSSTYIANLENAICELTEMITM